MSESALEILLRKHAFVVTGSGRAFIADSSPFLRPIKRGTLADVRFEICG